MHVALYTGTGTSISLDSSSSRTRDDEHERDDWRDARPTPVAEQLETSPSSQMWSGGGEPRGAVHAEVKLIVQFLLSVLSCEQSPVDQHRLHTGPS